MPETQWATVQFPDGRRVQKQIPSAMSDRELQGLFANEYKLAGFSSPGPVYHRDAPEAGWGKNLAAISNYKPMLGEKAQHWIAERLGGDRDAYQRSKKIFSFVNDATPVGNVTGMDEGGRQVYQGLSRGDLGQAALGAGVFALSALPVPGAAKRATKKATAGIFGNLARNTDGAIRAWHGSPHDFDRFDMSRIGTGEGAQSYGHGLYFAENRRVAEEYRDDLSERFLVNGVEAPRGGRIYGLLRHTSGDPEDAAQNALGKAISFQVGDPRRDEFIAISDHLKTAKVDRDFPGLLYEVNINAEPEDFLDWDAPLSGQPRAFQDLLRWNHQQGAMREANALERAGRDTLAELYYRQGSDPSGYLSKYSGATGGSFIANTMDGTMAGAIPTDELRRAGVPGLRYFDQGSRRKDGGTRNYVIFDDQLIDILNKY